MSIAYSVVANLYYGDLQKFKKSINGALSKDYMKFKYLSKHNLVNKGFVFDSESLKEAKENFRQYILDKSHAMGYAEIHEYTKTNELFTD